MCGIAGIYAYADKAPMPRSSELTVIRDHMRARGPDAAGIWAHSTRRILFGHRRLSIIDLSERATQPMMSDDGGLVIVFNGEIYNFAELKSELEAAGRTFRTNSDTEVLLHLYAAHGQDMVRRLRGMFAFAIWDETQRGLFLARDPYGIKPLYWAQDGGTFRFASQVKALLAGGALSREADPAGIVGFHLFGHVPEPFTTFETVRSLPAGTTMWVDTHGARQPVTYASIASLLSGRSLEIPDRNELANRVRAAVLDSVRAHLVADVEVGAFLSGGIDSGALVGLMRDAGQAKIRTVTLTYDEFRDTPQDEAPLAERVAQLYNTEHVTRRVDRTEFLNDLPLILDAMDQPSVDGVNTWFVSKACHELGLKVALSGVGGDELLGGYSTFDDLPRMRSLPGLAAMVPGMRPLWRGAIRFAPSRIRDNYPKIIGLLDYSRTWEGAYLLRRALRLPEQLTEVIDPEVAREGLSRLQPLKLLRRAITPDPGEPTARIMALESSAYMRSQLLRDTDWAGMAHSLEIRTPLVDIELLSTLAPLTGKLRSRKGKAALAAAPSIPLPSEVVHRRKTGFGVPMGAWASSPGSPSSGAASRHWARCVLPSAQTGDLPFNRASVGEGAAEQCEIKAPPPNSGQLHGPTDRLTRVHLCGRNSD